MTTYSMGDAAVSGFREIGRHWRLAAGWSVFMLLAAITLLVVSVVLGIALGAGGVGETGLALAGGLFGGIGFIAIGAVVQAAALRLVLQPDAPNGFLRMHVGADEWRLLALNLIYLLLGLPLLVAYSLASGVSDSLSVAFLVGVICLALWIWLMARLSLAMPLVVDGRRLDLAGAWRLSRGRAGQLLGTAVLVVCLMAMILIVQNLIMAGIAVATMGLSGLRALVEPDAGNPAHAAFSVFEVVVQFLLWPFYLLLWQAPLATAYRAFTEKAENADVD